MIYTQSYFNSKNRLEMIPVDFVAKVVSGVSADHANYALRSDSHGNQIPLSIHITNPRSLTYFKIFEAVKEFGYNVRLLSYSEWQQKLISDNSENNPLSGLFPYFAPNNFTMNSFNYDRTNLRQFLERKKLSDCAEATSALVHKYLSYLVDQGIISSPNNK